MGVLRAPIPASKVYRRRPEIRRQAGTVLSLCPSNPGPAASLAANGAAPLDSRFSGRHWLVAFQNFRLSLSPRIDSRQYVYNLNSSAPESVPVARPLNQ